jgi:hypothetical protein
VTRRRYHNVLVDSARWDHVDLRPDDIIISTPAKCGTTWMQTCCALLLFQSPDLPRPMAELSPWVEMLTWPIDELVALVESQEHRRFLKSHTPLHGLPWSTEVTYIVVGRDPRDVALSMDDHMLNMDLDKVITARVAAVGMDDLDPSMIPPPPSTDPVERFWQWMDHEGEDPINGLDGVVHHLASFWERRDEPNVHLFHYADLRDDLEGQMRRLAGVLGVEIADDTWPTLVKAATFAEMKQKADTLAPDTVHGIFQSNDAFFKQARSGAWREIIGDDTTRYDDRIASLAPPDLIAWLHR